MSAAHHAISLCFLLECPPLTLTLLASPLSLSLPLPLPWRWCRTSNQGIQVMGLSYGVIMVIFLGALVPAVANRNFQHQSKERWAMTKGLLRFELHIMRTPPTVCRSFSWVVVCCVDVGLLIRRRRL